MADVPPESSPGSERAAAAPTTDAASSGAVVVARPIGVPTARRPWLFDMWSPGRPRPLDLGDLPRSSAAWDLVLVLVAGLVAPLGLSFLFTLFGGRPPLEGGDGAAWLLIADKWVDLILVLSLTAYLVYRGGVRPAAFGLQLDRFDRQLAWVPVGVAGVYAVLLVTTLVIGIFVLLFRDVQTDLQNRAEFLSALPVNDLGATLLLMAIVAAHEELLFRGLLIPYLRRIGCGWAGAVVLSAAIFGVLHITQGWIGAAQVTLLGVAFGVVFVLSRSLVPVILTHFIFNVIQTQIARVLMRWLPDVLPPA